MAWQATIERTVSGLGYELVSCEWASQGLLRVTIDRMPGARYETGPGEAITVEDCELVTRQLQFALGDEVVDYKRLEVSSPGLDRLLAKPADYERFAGLAIDLTLRVPFEGRKRFRGVLRPGADVGDAAPWTLVFAEGKEDKVLGFELSEVREARLVPVVDFKRRRAEPSEAAPQQAIGEQPR